MSDTVSVPVVPDNPELSKSSQSLVEASGLQINPDIKNNGSNQTVVNEVSSTTRSESNPAKVELTGTTTNVTPEKVSLVEQNYSLIPIQENRQSSKNSSEIERKHEIEEDLELEDNDSASVLVIILQCETKSCDANITNLKWVFSDPYFTVQVCAVDPPPNIPTTKTLTQSQYMENYCMRKALTYAAEGPYLSNSQGTLEPQFWWTNIPVIIVKDSSISNITPSGITDEDHPDDLDNNIIGGMRRRIAIALDKARQADLFFLCKWHDACNKYVDVDGVGNINHGSTLKWSVQPTATQAIMYTPSSRDYIREALVTATVPLSDLLNSNISQGNLLATVFVPNIIDFDIDLATSNDDYNKLNECAPIHGTTGSTTNIASFLWFAVIVVVIILVAWALIQLGPQYAAAPNT